MSEWRFNPHRLLGVGATSPTARVADAHMVVSILTDSWESVQRSLPDGAWPWLSGFNPHRLLGVGATHGDSKLGIYAYTFQSSPTPGSRCNKPCLSDSPGLAAVSILTDSWESVQRGECGDLLTIAMFQSSPTPGSRCNDNSPVRCIFRVEFQSSPTPGSRCNIYAAETVYPINTFQSSPTPGSRCNVSMSLNSPILNMFQSSPTPGSRCNSPSAMPSRTMLRFNPHRLLGVGAT